MTAALAVARGLPLAALMLLFGSAVLLLRLRRAVPELGLESAGLRRARILCAALALAVTPVHLMLTTAAMAGSGAFAGFVALQLALTATLFGQMLAVRVVLLAALLAAVLLRRELATALLSAAALALIAVTSHAAGASPAGFSAIGIINDTLHLICGGLWLGGLMVLASILAGRSRAPRLGNAVSLFADWAVIAVTLLLLTGLINAAMVVLGTPGHAAKLYLEVLGAKLVLVLAMLALALGNHFRLMPRLARADARAILKGNISWEFMLGLCVVALASLLGLLSPTV